MKIYINRNSGLATTAATSTTPLASLGAILFATQFLDCVFVGDDGDPVELATDATGVFVAKREKQYTAAALVQALAWSKASSAAEGYRFQITPNADPLRDLLADQDNVPLMAQIVWKEGGIERATQKFSFTVANAVYRPDEPVLADPAAAWPLPGEIALKTDFNGTIKTGDIILTIENGLIKTYAIDNA